MKQFKKILVATDTRLDAHPIVDEAADTARQNDASLTIVDVVPELPGPLDNVGHLLVIGSTCGHPASSMLNF